MKKITPLFIALSLSLAVLPNMALANLEEGRTAYISKDYRNAFQVLLPIARQGDAQAQRLVGDMYLNGTGVARNEVDAAKWLRLSAEQSNTDAMTALAHMYVQGLGATQDLREAEKWFRKASSLSPGAGPAIATTTVGNFGLGGTNNGPCKQVAPEMPDTAVQAELMGSVIAGLFLVDGRPKDVIIFSGPRIFHEAVRKAMLRYECPLSMPTSVGIQEFVFNFDTSKDHYVAQQLAPAFAVRPPVFGANWLGLSADQRNTVRMQFGELPTQDAPPYPDMGMGPLLEDIRLVAEHLGVQGRLRLNAKIDGTGAVESVKVLASPDPELSRLATAVVYRTTFKGGVCSGQPCVMDFPVHVSIDCFCAAEREPKLKRLIAVAQSGDPIAQNDLGNHYEHGRGMPKDLNQAAHWYRLSAEQGYFLGQYNYGRALQFGLGVETNLVEAVSWYRRSAGQGYSRAQNNYGSMLRDGQGVPVDLAEAVKWLRKSADQGDPWGQNSLGYAYERGLGVMWDSGRGVKWYRKSADQGYAPAQNNLADAYENGLGVSIDLELALKWYGLAAEQKNRTAIYSLSHMYASGRGVPQDPDKALSMLSEAAALGFPKAQFELAQLYADGKGLGKDTDTAVQWYRKAAKSGFKKAVDRLKELGVQM